MMKHDSEYVKPRPFYYKVAYAIMYVPIQIAIFIWNWKEFIRNVGLEKRHIEMKNKPVELDLPDLPDEMASDEEIEAYFAAKRKAEEQWLKENRVKLFFYGFASMFVLPPVIAYNWYQRRKEALKGKR